MMDQIPLRAWVLLTVAAVAYAPAAYIYRYNAHSLRDVIQRPGDRESFTPKKLAKNIALLFALAAFSIFIFTQAATDFARSPDLVPILLLMFGLGAGWTVVDGHLSGIVGPLVRGFSWHFERASQPWRYWLSMGWNLLLSGLFLFGAFSAFNDAGVQASTERCENGKQQFSKGDVLTACNELIVRYRDDGEQRAVVTSYRGTAYFFAEDYYHALMDYEKAASLDPEDPAYPYNIALVNDDLGYQRRALENYAKAIALDPNYGAAYASRGQIFLNTGKMDQAIADFTHAYDLDPTKVWLLAQRGLAYAWTHDRVRAEKDFAEVRRRDPTNITLLHGEAILAMNSGKLSDAARYLTTAIERDPADDWALWMRSRIHGRQGDDAMTRADADAAARVERERKD